MTPVSGGCPRRLTATENQESTQGGKQGNAPTLPVARMASLGLGTGCCKRLEGRCNDSLFNRLLQNALFSQQGVRRFAQAELFRACRPFWAKTLSVAFPSAVIIQTPTARALAALLACEASYGGLDAQSIGSARVGLWTGRFIAAGPGTKPVCATES